jgi:thiosulfate reductase cytochrome b subunit
MKRIYLHPGPIRLWHWVNAASFLVLIVTGLQLRYREALSLMSFKQAVDIHNVFGFVLLFNYGIWLAYYLLTGKIKIYLPPASLGKFIKKAIAQAKFYGYGIFLGDENPHHSTPDNKFNPLQQTAYLQIMALLIPVQILTGLMLWDMKRFAGLLNLAGGVKIVDTVHVFLFLFFASFMIVHIYLATLGHTPTAHIKAMITGYEEEHEAGH